MNILRSISTIAPAKFSKKQAEKQISSFHEKIFSLQHKLYADSSHPILIILQGMDTSGKDGTIRHVFSCINPMGCNVKSFKTPTIEERKHDFLWRIYPHLPEQGMIQIFNRSHYEDILMPTIEKSLPEELIEERYHYINCFEKQLQASGTIIMKFFLHISKKEQDKRIKARKKDPNKKWKYDKSDDKAALQWDSYEKIYTQIINKCGEETPWQIVPADQKWYRNFFVANQIINKLESLNLKYPS